jgi:hypothetical protein
MTLVSELDQAYSSCQAGVFVHSALKGNASTLGALKG